MNKNEKMKGDSCGCPTDGGVTSESCDRERLMNETDDLDGTKGAREDYRRDDNELPVTDISEETGGDKDGKSYWSK